MSIIKNYRLRLDAGNITPLIIHVNQYDKNEIWNFTLIDYQGNQYITTEAAIVGKKPDGCLIANNCTVSEGIVSVEVTEQMTAAAGKAVFELLVDGQMHGTANFFVMIERSPEDGAIESESDLSLFQQAIDATSTPAIIAGVQAWMDENLTPTTPVVDSSLSISGAAADAKKTGDEINDLKSAIEQIDVSGIPATVKQAMATLFNSALYKDTGLTDEKSVIQAWASTVTAITLNQSAISINGVGTYQLVATTTPSGGAVTWASSNTAVATVSSNGLVTSVGNGTATITASSGDVSATCTATITGFATLTSISAVYTQVGTVYTTDSLDSLKANLVVTAHYNDSSTATLDDDAYTLSGTLAVGTSTIVVSYGGFTATFNVTVTEQLVPSMYQQVEWVGATLSASQLGPYIATGFTATEKAGMTGYDITLDCMVSETTASTGGLTNPIITWSSNSACYFGAIRIGVGNIRMGAGNSAGQYMSEAVVPANRNTYRVYWDSTSLHAESGAYSCTRAFIAGSVDLSLRIGTGTYDNVHSGSFRIYGEVTIKKDNAVVARLFPCYRKSDGVIGFYDSVRSTFYTNDGAGSFTKGDNI